METNELIVIFCCETGHRSFGIGSMQIGGHSSASLERSAEFAPPSNCRMAQTEGLNCGNHTQTHPNRKT